jgi:hypothetical protein
MFPCLFVMLIFGDIRPDNMKGAEGRRRELTFRLGRAVVRRCGPALRAILSPRAMPLGSSAPTEVCSPPRELEPRQLADNLLSSFVSYRADATGPLWSILECWGHL